MDFKAKENLENYLAKVFMLEKISKWEWGFLDRIIIKMTGQTNIMYFGGQIREICHNMGLSLRF